MEKNTDLETELLSIVQGFVIESGAERARLAVTLSAALDRDLGIGSLERVELFLRVEKAFSVTLKPSQMSDVKTVGDLAKAVRHAGPAGTTYRAKTPIALADHGVRMSEARSLTDILKSFADREPERPQVYLQDEDGNEEVITYGALYREATAVAAGLAGLGLKPQETVAIMLPTCAEFFQSFLGVLLAGAIPVPIYPPFRADQIEEYAKREALILRNAEIRVLITFQKAEGLSRVLGGFIPSLKAVSTCGKLKVHGRGAPDLPITENDPALIQYTSGSTGNPKGVLLTHRNLLSNVRAFGQALSITPRDVIASWLPLYHDMGLIGVWMGSFYHGVPAVIMSPLIFLKRPERWLWTIHYHRATLSGGPNFAYELCVRNIDEHLIEGLDLGCWRVAANGAEPIYPGTVERFTGKFRKYGFRPEAFFPVYGLAESSLAVAFPPLGRAPVIDAVMREPFEKDGAAIPAPPKDKSALKFVSCGFPLPGHSVRIVGDDGRPVEERRVGTLHFSGPSSMQGYYHNPAATSEIFHDGWWSSGDLAYMAGGEIYIAGRRKDMIIKGGHNLYPAEIEEVAGQVEGIRRGCVVAFGAGDQEQGTEKIVIVAETREKNAAARGAMVKAIIEKTTAALGISPDHVILAPPKTIPKTSSGKLQRSACRQAYLEGRLEKRGGSVLIQFARIYASSIVKRAGRAAGNIVRLAYSAYAFAVFSAFAVPFATAVLLVPEKAARKICRGWALATVRMAGLPVLVRGREHLPENRPAVYAANHASYLDFLVLLAILPEDILFTAKREFMSMPLLGAVIRKLGYLPIDRSDAAQRLYITGRIKETLTRGNSVVFFPEGTFTYAMGLRPFKSGAFKIAAESAAPVCAVAIRGTRTILREGEWLLRPGIIRVHISPPMLPEGSEWKHVIRLRNRVREEIALNCGESPIDLIRAGYEKEE